jgi:large subunit ribosomal protein L11
MAKKIIKQLKVTAPGGRATPAPPLGPTLGQAGVAIGEFVTQFNERTKEMPGELIPALVTVYEDRSFTFELKTPKTSSLILKAINQEKGSGRNRAKKVGKLPKAKLREIAEKKMPDLNAHTVEQAERIVEGTAKSMGVEMGK